MEILDLQGQWNIDSKDGQYKLTGDVPGSLFYTLEQRGDFGEEGLFYRENNNVCLDIADRDFVYSREFTVEDSLLNSDFVFLEAEGLDTLTDIIINGKKIAETDNMHRTWRFNITRDLIPGKNTIAILFKNSLEFLRREKKRRNIFSADNGGITSVEGFNMIRKSHCSYGWDWGPKVPDLGIWRDLNIVSYNSARLNSVHVTQIHENEKVTLELHPDLDTYEKGDFQINVELTTPDGKEESFTIAADKLSEYEIKNPQLWWPNGLGDQPLYGMVFTLMDGEEEIDFLAMNVGLRTLSIEQKKDEWGETFNFLCNGISVFARGANYIPEDAFLNRNGNYTTEQLIKDCAAANYNTLRVWGGGIYPSDHLFDLCDEYGLIVWEDMMFACAIYDVKNDNFLENIKQELVDNLTRIRHHACMGLICGNNEMEWGIQSWFKATNEEKAEYLKQYQFVFPEIIKKVCPELFYWPASPSSGGNFEDPNSPDSGDCHFWEVWHGNMDFSEYKNHYFRFMSEFGFESFPSMKTIRSFTVEEDLNIFSPVMEEHQKCIDGNGKILNYVSKYFKYPKDLNSLVYVSQLSQAEAITTGIEHWRRNRGRCMGSTYWQVNDNWPVASWSSIDYYGRWKALHYAAKRSYDNVLVSCDGDDKSAAFHLSNEGKDIVSGKLEWKLFSLTGEIIDQGSVEVTANPFSSKLIEKRDFSEELKDNKNREIYLSYVFTESNGKSHRNSHYFAPFKYLDLQNPALSVIVSDKGNQFAFTVNSKKPSLFVELDFKEMDAVFSDNYFSMDGGETRTITIEKSNHTLEHIKEQIQIRSLFSTY
ncbi:MAG: glycoside hydrolase family 2 protein [Spirochaetaceae bacterium]|jgi:beta-mannosidase|nr:glycoside hydrolase family 2 protein [Spirochaetaceae bacterium]